MKKLFVITVLTLLFLNSFAGGPSSMMKKIKEDKKIHELYQRNKRISEIRDSLEISEKKLKKKKETVTTSSPINEITEFNNLVREVRRLKSILLPLEEKRDILRARLEEDYSKSMVMRALILEDQKQKKIKKQARSNQARVFYLPKKCFSV